MVVAGIVAVEVAVGRSAAAKVAAGQTIAKVGCSRQAVAISRRGPS